MAKKNDVLPTRARLYSETIFLRYLQSLLYRQWVLSVQDCEGAVLQLSEKIADLLSENPWCWQIPVGAAQTIPTRAATAIGATIPTTATTATRATRASHQRSVRSKPILQQCLWYQQRIHQYMLQQQQKRAHEFMEIQVERELFRLRNEVGIAR